jgi:hypothetical protein
MSCLLRISSLSLRFALAAAVIVSVTAARVVPPRPSIRMSEATPAEVPVLISSQLGESPRPPTAWTEGGSGRTIFLPPPGGMLLEFGVCSPWRDAEGRFQVAGRLSGEGVGLARVSFPDGDVLDFVQTGCALLTSRPCWLPGPRPKVLFGAGDGRIYQYAFDDEGATNSDAERLTDPRLSRIDWRPPDPSKAGVFLSDPSWLRGGWTDDLLVLVVASGAIPGRDASSSSNQLWWARLDEAGGAIVEAGVLIDSPSLSGGRYLRSPVSEKTAEGGGVLAYLCTDRPGTGHWELRTTRLSFDDSGRPQASATVGVKVAGRCFTELPPTLTTDGRRVWVLQAGDEGRGRVVQIPLPGADVAEDSGPAATRLVTADVRGLSSDQRRSSYGTRRGLR